MKRMIFALCAVALAAPAFGQARPAPRQPPPPQSTEILERMDRPALLQELSRVVGASHYLRRLCASDGPGRYEWYQWMQGLLDREAPRNQARAAALRSQMANAFNAGYRAEEIRFPSCTAAVPSVEEDLRKRGRRLTSALAATARPQ